MNVLKLLRDKSIIVILIILLLLANADSADYSCKVAVVKSSLADEYEQAFSGFISSLEASRFVFEMRNYNLDEQGTSVEKIVTSIRLFAPDVIATIGSPATKRVSEYFNDIPVIFMMVLNPEIQGLLSTPSGANQNIHGVSLDVPAHLQFKELHHVLPNIKRISAIYNPDHDKKIIDEAKLAASNFSIELIAKEIYSEKDIPAALENLKHQSDLFWIIPNPRTISNSTLQYILSYCISNNLPVLGLSESQVKLGALLAVAPDFKATGKSAANLVLRFIQKKPFTRQTIIAPKETRLCINQRIANLVKMPIPVFALRSAQVFP